MLGPTIPRPPPKTPVSPINPWISFAFTSDRAFIAPIDATSCGSTAGPSGALRWQTAQFVRAGSFVRPHAGQCHGAVRFFGGDGAGSRTPAATSSIFAATRRLTERTASVDGSASRTEHMYCWVRWSAKAPRASGVVSEFWASQASTAFEKSRSTPATFWASGSSFDAFVGVLPPLAVGDLEGGGRLSFFGRSGRPSGPRSCASSDGGGGRRCRASARATPPAAARAGPAREVGQLARARLGQGVHARASRVRRAFG